MAKESGASEFGELDLARRLLLAERLAKLVMEHFARLNVVPPAFAILLEDDPPIVSGAFCDDRDLVAIRAAFESSRKSHPGKIDELERMDKN